MWAKRRVSVFGAALFFKLLTDHKEPATETRHPKWSLIHRLSRSLAVCRSFFQFSVSLPVLSASSSLVPQSPAAVIKSIYSTGNRVSFAFFYLIFKNLMPLIQPSRQEAMMTRVLCSVSKVCVKFSWQSLDRNMTSTFEFISVGLPFTPFTLPPSSSSSVTCSGKSDLTR